MSKLMIAIIIIQWIIIFLMWKMKCKRSISTVSYTITSSSGIQSSADKLIEALDKARGEKSNDKKDV